MPQCQPRRWAKTQRRSVTGALLHTARPASSPTAHTLLQLYRSAWAPPSIQQASDGPGCRPGSRETQEAAGLLPRGATGEVGRERHRNTHPL